MSRQWAAAILGASLAAFLGARAGDDPADDKAKGAEFLEPARSEASAYLIQDGDGARRTLRPGQVLRRSNPVVRWGGGGDPGAPSIAFCFGALTTVPRRSP